MFPMVSEPWEFDAAQALVEEQREWLRKQGEPMASQVKYGAMLEVPALAEQLDVLLPKIDFLSIGTNDLTQFLFAADRANPKRSDEHTSELQSLMSTSSAVFCLKKTKKRRQN